MQIYVRTDTNIDGSGKLTAYVEGEVAAALSRFSDHITRVEVHLSDESGGRATGADVRCMIEARPAGQTPVTVTDDAGSVDAALLVRSARCRLLDHEGRQEDHMPAPRSVAVRPSDRRTDKSHAGERIVPRSGRRK